MQNNKTVTYALCLLTGGIIFMADLAIPLGVAGGVPYIAVVLLSLWSPNKNFTLIVSIGCSVLTIGGLFLSPMGGEMWKVLANRGLALFAIWVTAALTIQRKSIEEKREIAVAEREKALEDMRILQGLIPMCASCKKIRDDKGYWKQIEVYITEHSEARLSHGICPDCAKKLYPDIDFG